MLATRRQHMMTAVGIRASARNHGVDDADMRHAVRNFIDVFEDPEDSAVLIFVGPARDAALLEVGVVDGDTIIHAMPVRPKFLR